MEKSRFVTCNEYRTRSVKSTAVGFDFVSTGGNVPSTAEISVGQVCPISGKTVTQDMLSEYIREANRQVNSHLRQISVPLGKRDALERKVPREQTRAEIEASTGEKLKPGKLNAIMQLRHPKQYNYSYDKLFSKGFDFPDPASEDALRDVETEMLAEEFLALFSGRLLIVARYLVATSGNQLTWGWKTRLANELHVTPALIDHDVKQIRETYRTWMKED